MERKKRRSYQTLPYTSCRNREAHVATDVEHSASCGADACHHTVFVDVCRRGDAVFEVGIRAKKIGAVLRFVDDDLRARQKFFISSGTRGPHAREYWTLSYRMLLPDGSEG
eukprot:5856037-Pyramimonas_sp.AAC.1